MLTESKLQLGAPVEKIGFDILVILMQYFKFHFQEFSACSLSLSDDKISSDGQTFILK